MTKPRGAIEKSFAVTVSNEGTTGIDTKGASVKPYPWKDSSVEDYDKND